jgi:lactoylglutathione lyase
MTDLQTDILTIVDRLAGRCSWYQLGRSLSGPDVSMAELMREVRALIDGGFIRVVQVDEHLMERYALTETGSELLLPVVANLASEEVIQALEKPTLNLAVIRSSDIHRSAAFYRLLGLTFELHRHGNGPEHYSYQNRGAVFEIYPATTEGVNAELRIGFAVTSVDSVVCVLESGGTNVISPPKDSPWGRRAVVEDPDGYKIELTERNMEPTTS